MSHTSNMTHVGKLDHECPCPTCDHGRVGKCIKEGCYCCGLEDAFYLFTGAYVEQEKAGL